MPIPSRERHLGTLGYRSVAVDLYEGKSATRHDEAVKLMQSLDRKATDKILQAGLDVMVYGFGFDKVDTKTLERLQSPVLVIAGGEDTGATQAAVTFLSTIREATKRPCEIFIYPGADHGYAQSLFNEEKSYNLEAVRILWVLVQDFLATHLV